MREIRIDEYYLSEQDEPTVRGRVDDGGAKGRGAGGGREGASARRRARTVRRRLHLLRRAAAVALRA